MSAIAEPIVHSYTGPVEQAGLAEVLSPSRVNTYLSCSARYWYKYGLQLPDVQGSSLAIGKALHSAMKINFEQKIETKQDLPLAGVLGVYNDAWNQELERTEFEDGENKDDLKQMGASLVQKYLDEAAPHIEPAAVEMPVSGSIGGVPVRGIIDLLDVNGRIIDLKSANKSPSKGRIRPDYRFQVATYAALAPQASGEVRLDTIVKLKREVKLVPQTFQLGPADLRQVEVMYPLAKEGMLSGIYTPQRNGFLCSRRYCPYWRSCEADFGGVVAGGEDE